MVSSFTPLDGLPPLAYKRALRPVSASSSRMTKWNGSGGCCGAEEATDITDGDERSLSATLSPERTERIDGLLLETSKLPCVDLDIDG